MVELLDCTLRDGGYYTDWDFDPLTIRTYLSSMSRLPIDHVELGYVNDPQNGYSGEFYFLSPERLTQARAALRPSQKLVVMVDGKGYAPDRMGPLFGHLSSIIDMVRITVAPTALSHGVSLGRALKAAGVKVGFNVMYLSTFQDDLSKIAAVFEDQDAFDSIALVDSYGGCSPTKVREVFRSLRKALPSKPLGFHGHDNMCLAFANSLAAIEGGADIIDGTLVGMGRGAGNLRIETLLVHLDSEANDHSLDYQALSAAIEPFEELQVRYRWGTNLPYMISGANNLPQKDVMNWISKNRYSVLSIIQALQRQSNSEVDTTAHPVQERMANPSRPVLVVGGGNSVRTHLDAIRRYVSKTDALILFASTRHLDLASTIGGEQLFCLPGHAALRADVEDNLSTISGCIVAPPPRVTGCIPPGIGVPVRQTKALAAGEEENIGPVSDISPLDLALGAVAALGTQECALIGFDGYAMASAAEQDLSLEVQRMLDLFRSKHPTVRLHSLTPTRYQLDVVSVYGLVSAIQ
jgi:4-hydroxy 2-oxovalerate aldolase